MDDPTVIAESIEDVVDHDDDAQEKEFETLVEDIEKEIDITPATQEEREVLAGIILNSATSAGIVLPLFNSHLETSNA